MVRVLPIVRENLKAQKERYNGTKEEPIIIPRNARLDGVNQGPHEEDEQFYEQGTSADNLSRNGGRAYSRGAGSAQGRVRQEVWDNEIRVVPRHSIRRDSADAAYIESQLEEAQGQPRTSLMRPTNEEVTFDNFSKSTSAVFEAMPKSEVPQREADYASERWDGFGVSSRYWYGEDERGKYVIRESNHWSSLLHGERIRAAFEDDPIFKNSLNLLCAFGFPISTFFLIFAELKK